MAATGEKIDIGNEHYEVQHVHPEYQNAPRQITIKGQKLRHMTIVRGHHVFTVPESMWEEAHRAQELENLVALSRHDADDAIAKLDQLRTQLGDKDAIEALQDRIAELEKELADQRASYPEDHLWFALDPDQKSKYVEWTAMRHRDFPAEDGAIGGRFSLKFTQTGIGIAISVVDCVGPAEENLTNYDDW